MDKPDVDSIEGLSPAISIDQKTTSRNPRSTVGTVTEIYDYLRLLWARVGHPHCHNCGAPIAGQSVEQIVDNLMTLDEGTRFMVLAPVVRGRKGEYKDLLEELRAEGYTRAKIDGELRLLEDDDRARQEVQARHRGGRGPARDEARLAQAARRLGRDGGRAGGGLVEVELLDEKPSAESRRPLERSDGASREGRARSSSRRSSRA